MRSSISSLRVPSRPVQLWVHHKHIQVCSWRCVHVPLSLNFSRLLSAFSYFLLPLSPHMLTAHACNTGREYATADMCSGTAVLTVITLELLTFFGPMPLSVLIVYQIVKGYPVWYYWITVLSTAKHLQWVRRNHLSAENREVVHSHACVCRWITLCPQWLTGNLALDTSNVHYFWVYSELFHTA
jgi:hypothetical protein